MDRISLVRYGAIPEVARFTVKTDAPLSRGEAVVVRTHRGLQLGQYLDEIRPAATDGRPQDADSNFDLLRPADETDRLSAEASRASAEAEFARWQMRIRSWNLQLELIDLEWTLDREKLILYVLNERGPECTKLALQAAAAGLGIIEVQPVGPEGLVPLESGGCGSGGGCGCH